MHHVFETSILFGLSWLVHTMSGPLWWTSITVNMHLEGALDDKRVVMS